MPIIRPRERVFLDGALWAATQNGCNIVRLRGADGLVEMNPRATARPGPSDLRIAEDSC